MMGVSYYGVKLECIVVVELNVENESRFRVEVLWIII